MISVNWFTYFFAFSAIAVISGSPVSDDSDFGIIHGVESTPYSAPYMVFIDVSAPGRGRGRCGGTLLTPEYVMTAGHCVSGTTIHKLLFGVHNISDTTEPHRIQRYKSRGFVHENYTEKHYDIAIIQLNESVPLSDYIGTVDIPLHSDPSNSYLNQMMTAYGWGRTENGSVSAVLRNVDLPVMNFTECKGNIETHRVDLDDDGSQICFSTNNNKDTCTGDSGGPMMLNGIQIGITSFGAVDCANGIPAVAARVDYFLDWIQSKTKIPDIDIR